MLLPRTLPEKFAEWNRRWGAPNGHASLARLVRRRALERTGLGNSKSAMRAAGPFALQGNNDTRTVEYPWAWFSAGGDVTGRDVLEVGGALSGFQFALSKSGARVVNVDPGEHDGEYWEHRLPLDQATIARLNRTFRTDVRLQGTTLPDAQLPESSVDLVFSISTIEHVPHDDALQLAAEIGRILRPGGRCSLTIDLFLDLVPFSDRASNRWGRNIDVREFVDATGLDLVEGDVTKLVGYDSFDTNAIVANLGDYFVGSGHPTCAQALVLEKHAP